MVLGGWRKLSCLKFVQFILANIVGSIALRQEFFVLILVAAK
jgi:hypothetical protein